MEIIFSSQDAFRVEIVTISGNLHILMNPVSVLLNHVPIELVHRKASSLPPSIGHKSHPCEHTSHTNPTEVLVKLSFVDFADTITSNGYESTSDSLSGEQKQCGETPGSNRSRECVSIYISLKEIIEVSGVGESEF